MSIFFTSRKIVLKSCLDTSSIASCLSSSLSFFILLSWQLLDTWWIDRESSCLLDSWWIDRAFVLAFDGLFLDTSSIPVSVNDHFLDTFLDSYLDTSQCLYLSSFTKDLYIHSLRSGSHFFDLSRSVRTYSSPKHYLFHSKPLPLWFFQHFQDFLLLVSF